MLSSFMWGAHRCLQYAFGLALLASCPCSFALDPALDVSQYAHTPWRVREGFAKGAVNSIAQTPDGYLWLGTDFGLSRFDGVRSVPWLPPDGSPPDGQQLPNGQIRTLLVTRDGRLWIGTQAGLASWKDGKLTHYPELTGQEITALLEDSQETIWVGSLGTPTGRLCAIQSAGVKCHGEDGSLGSGVFSLAEYQGHLWAGTARGLWQWNTDFPTGLPKVYSLADPLAEPNTLFEGDNGNLWIGLRGGVGQLAGGEVQPYPLPGVGNFRVERVLRDRDGGLWIATLGLGVVHLHHGVADTFTSADGLSGGTVHCVFQDREGNIWVGTEDGFDRFRDFAVATISSKQGLSQTNATAVLAARDGSVWVSTYNGLNRWKDGQWTVYGKQGNRSSALQAPTLTAGLLTKPGRVREVNDSGLSGNSFACLFEDNQGRIWVSSVRGLAYFENGRFIPVSSVPSQIAHSIAEDDSGSIWIADQEHGLLRLVGGRLSDQTPWANLGHEDPATAMVFDRKRGGLWLGFFHGGLAYFKDGRIRASYTAAEGLGEGRVNDLSLDPDGTLWAATDGGLSRLNTSLSNNGRLATLTSQNGLLCEAIHWAIGDDANSYWLETPCGLVRIARSELEAWAGDPKRMVKTTVFDISDGVRSMSLASGYTPHVAKAQDGTLWFISLDGVSVVHPRHLPFNKLPPPVQVQQVTADRKVYDAPPDGSLRLPPLLRDLEIDFTALSFVEPEKVHFRYKLEGHDRDWQEVGTRRQAFYNDLPPRGYRFRVMASNDNGVWNETGAFVDFAIAPAFYQTIGFRAAGIAAFLALLAGLYQLRVRQVAQHLNIRMEARLNERMRIARDLHDTLLQSFQGVLLKFHAVTYLLPDRPDARTSLEGVIDQARQAITEGRDAVEGLRSSLSVTNDLEQDIRTIGKGLAAEQDGRNGPEFRVQVEGESRDLAPLLRDEIFRIASEALRNAFRHARAGRIEVEIRYGQRQLRLRVRDDGRGIEQEVLDRSSHAGHYGLPGMHERAKLISGKLEVWSETDSGTEIELTVPGGVVYAKPAGARRWIFAGKA